MLAWLQKECGPINTELNVSQIQSLPDERELCQQANIAISISYTTPQSLSQFFNLTWLAAN